MTLYKCLNSDVFTMCYHAIMLLKLNLTAFDPIMGLCWSNFISSMQTQTHFVIPRKKEKILYSTKQCRNLTSQLRIGYILVLLSSRFLLICSVCKFSYELSAWFSFLLLKKRGKKHSASVIVQMWINVRHFAPLHSYYRFAILLFIPIRTDSMTPVPFFLSFYFGVFCICLLFFIRKFHSFHLVEKPEFRTSDDILGWMLTWAAFQAYCNYTLGANSRTLLSSRLSSFFIFFLVWKLFLLLCFL